jgi:hypothetical protein
MKGGCVSAESDEKKIATVCSMPFSKGEFMMKKIGCITALIVMCLVAMPLMAQANLIVDGDFATAPAIPGAKAVDTWYVTYGPNGGPTVVPLSYVTGSAVFTGSSTSYFNNSNTAMTTLRYLTGPTAANTTYALSFDYKAQGSGFTGGGTNTSGDTSVMQLQILDYNGLGGTGAVTVAGGGDITAATGDVWTNYLVTYTARSDNQSLILKWNVAMGAGNGVSGIGYVADSFKLDNVSLSAVPIPAAAWLLGSGLIGLIGIRRRFRK